MTLKHITELTTRELDCAVGIAEGLEIEFLPDFGFYGIRDKDDPIAAERIPAYSTEWLYGGPLIEKYNIEFAVHPKGIEAFTQTKTEGNVGETHLDATCRAVVAAKLGEYVDVPDDMDD